MMWAVATIWLMPQDPTRQVIVGFFFIAAVSSGVATLSPVRFGYAAMLVPFLCPFATTSSCSAINAWRSVTAPCFSC